MQHCFVVVAVLLLFAVTRCKDFEDCSTDHTSVVKIQFKAKDKQPATIKFDKVTVVDSKQWFDKLEIPNNQILYLPLNPNATATEFIFHSPMPAAQATLRIAYKRVVSLIAPQCGAQQAYILQEVKHTFAREPISPVSQTKAVKLGRIIQPHLSQRNSEVNVEIYF